MNDENVISVKLIADAGELTSTVDAMVADVKSALGILRSEINKTSAAMKLPDADQMGLKESLNAMSWQFASIDGGLKTVLKDWDQIAAKIQQAVLSMANWREIASGQSTGSGLPYPEADVQAARAKIQQAADSLASALIQARPVIEQTEKLHSFSVSQATQPGVLEGALPNSPSARSQPAEPPPAPAPSQLPSVPLAGETPAAPPVIARPAPEESRAGAEGYFRDALQYDAARSQRAQQEDGERYRPPNPYIVEENRQYRAKKAAGLYGLSHEEALRLYDQIAPTVGSDTKLTSKSIESESKAPVPPQPVYRPDSAPALNAIEQVRANEAQKTQRIEAEIAQQRDEKLARSGFDLSKFEYAPEGAEPTQVTQPIPAAEVTPELAKQEPVKVQQPAPPFEGAATRTEIDSFFQKVAGEHADRPEIQSLATKFQERGIHRDLLDALAASNPVKTPPGTIPEYRPLRIAATPFVSEGAAGDGKGELGHFIREHNTIRYAGEGPNPERTVAHEMGHAVDHLSNEALGKTYSQSLEHPGSDVDQAERFANSFAAHYTNPNPEETFSHAGPRYDSLKGFLRGEAGTFGDASATPAPATKPELPWIAELNGQRIAEAKDREQLAQATVAALGKQKDFEASSYDAIRRELQVEGLSFRELGGAKSDVETGPQPFIPDASKTTAPVEPSIVRTSASKVEQPSAPPPAIEASQHPRFEDAATFARSQETLSQKQLQEALSVPRSDAKTLLEQLETQGVVGPAVPFQPRQVLKPSNDAGSAKAPDNISTESKTPPLPPGEVLTRPTPEQRYLHERISNRVAFPDYKPPKGFFDVGDPEEKQRRIEQLQFEEQADRQGATLYHGTGDAILPDILREGIKQGSENSAVGPNTVSHIGGDKIGYETWEEAPQEWRKKFKDRVYASRHLDEAQDYATTPRTGGSGMVLKLDIPPEQFQKFEEDPLAEWGEYPDRKAYPGVIEPEHITGISRQTEQGFGPFVPLHEDPQAAQILQQLGREPVNTKATVAPESETPAAPERQQSETPAAPELGEITKSVSSANPAAAAPPAAPPPAPPAPPAPPPGGDEPPPEDNRPKRTPFNVDLGKFDIVENAEERLLRLQTERTQAFTPLPSAQAALEEKSTAEQRARQQRDLADFQLNGPGQGRELTDDPAKLAPLERDLAEAEAQVARTERERALAAQTLAETQQKALALDRQVVEAGGASIAPKTPQTQSSASVQQTKQQEATAFEQASERETRSLNETAQASEAYQTKIRQAAQAGSDAFAGGVAVADEAMQKEAATAQTTAEQVTQARTTSAQRETQLSQNTARDRQTEARRTAAVEQTAAAEGASATMTAGEKVATVYRAETSASQEAVAAQIRGSQEAAQALDGQASRIAALKTLQDGLRQQKKAADAEALLANKNLQSAEELLGASIRNGNQQSARAIQQYREEVAQAEARQRLFNEALITTTLLLKEQSRAGGGVNSYMLGRLVGADVSGGLGSLSNVFARLAAQSKGLQDIMGATFDAFLVVGMVEMVEQLIMKVIELERAWDPAYQAEKRYDEQTKKSLEDLKKLTAEEDRLQRARMLREHGPTFVAKEDSDDAEAAKRAAEREIERIDQEIAKKQKIIGENTVVSYGTSGQVRSRTTNKTADAAQIDIDGLERDRENAEHALRVAQHALGEAKAEVTKDQAKDLKDSVEEQINLLRMQGRYTAAAEAQMWGEVAEKTKDGGHETETVYHEALGRRAQLLRQAAREATEILRQHDQEEFADLQATHKLTLAEEIAFWEKKLALEKANADRSREIKRTLGGLEQRRDTEGDRRAAQAENRFSEGLTGPDGKPDRRKQLDYFNQVLADTKPQPQDQIALPAAAAPRTIPEQITKTAQDAGVDPKIALAVAERESGTRQFDQNGQVKKSNAGALGVMQLMPDTAAGLGVNAYDTTQNIQGGITYLSQLFQKYGDWSKALQAYNWGPGHMDKGGPVPQDVQGYASGILARSQQMEVPKLPVATVPRTPQTTQQFENAQNQIARLSAEDERHTQEEIVKQDKQAWQEREQNHAVSLQEEINFWKAIVDAADKETPRYDQALQKYSAAEQKLLEQRLKIQAIQAQIDAIREEKAFKRQETFIQAAPELGLPVPGAKRNPLPTGKADIAQAITTLGSSNSEAVQQDKAMQQVHADEYAAAVAENGKEIAAAQGKEDKLAELRRRRAEIDARYDQVQLQDQIKLTKDLEQNWQRFFDTFNQGFLHAIGMAMQGQQGFGRSMGQLYNQLLIQQVQYVAQFLLHEAQKWAMAKLFALQHLAVHSAANVAKTASDTVANTAATAGAVTATAAKVAGDVTSTGVHVATNEVKVASDASAAAQSHSISIAEHVKEAFADAKLAAAHAFTATVGIPFIGPVLAPVAAGAAFAGVLALAAFEQGGIVPNTGVAMVHGGEMVLPAALSAKVQNSVTQPATTNNVTNTTTDTGNAAILQQIANNTLAMAKAMGATPVDPNKPTTGASSSQTQGFGDQLKQSFTDGLTNMLGIPRHHYTQENQIQLLQEIADNTSNLKGGLLGGLGGRLLGGLLPLPFFEDGGVVPTTGPAVLHKNEMVLPSHIASHVLNTAGSPATTNIYSDLASYAPANPGVLASANNAPSAPTIQQISQDSQTSGDTHVHLTYAPTITGAPNMSKADFGAMLREHADDVGRIAQQKFKQYNR